MHQVSHGALRALKWEIPSGVLQPSAPRAETRLGEAANLHAEEAISQRAKTDYRKAADWRPKLADKGQ